MIEMTEISRENNAKFMLTKCQTHQGQTLYEIRNMNMAEDKGQILLYQTPDGEYYNYQRGVSRPFISRRSIPHVGNGNTTWL